jgi:hypothetical protein
MSPSANAANASRVSPRTLGALACLASAAIAYVASVSVPMRPQGGDTVPGRLGAAALACAGTLDLREVEWVAERAKRRSLPYWVRPAPDGRLVSTFGRAAPILGSVMMIDLRPGDVVTDRDLQSRARHAAALAIALAAALLALALLASVSPLRAVAGATTAALSFAGCATLGQGLWQQTPALPFFMAAVAALAHGRQFPRILPFVPLLIGAALVLRPPALGIAAGLGLAWVLRARESPNRGFVLGAGLTFVAATATWMIAWSLADHGTVFPSSQLDVIAAMEPDGAALRSVGEVLTGLAGLVVSPARGLLFFAPIVLLALYVGWRRGDGATRAMVAAIVLQWIVVALFKWWGGNSFGPRLLAETVFIAAFVCFANGAAPATAGRGARVALTVSAVWTIAIGIVGLVGHDPRLWEMRRDPDRHREALWDFADSPLVAIFTQPAPNFVARDAAPGPFVYCAPKTLRAPAPTPARGTSGALGKPETAPRFSGATNDARDTAGGWRRPARPARRFDELAARSPIIGSARCEG